jgi:crotonobetainyl-CoA:carnitine CoA-transferase CaiB-like acyl-CoA transferase
MQPLEGIRVVEVAMWAFVPSAGAMLADMGANVVKLESPEGDPIRELVMAGIKPGTNGLTYMWEIFNRGKRSVAIDLRHPTGQRILHDLVRRADVFLVSLLPDSRQRLGIDVSPPPSPTASAPARDRSSTVRCWRRPCGPCRPGSSGRACSTSTPCRK